MRQQSKDKFFTVSSLNVDSSLALLNDANNIHISGGFTSLPLHFDVSRHTGMFFRLSGASWIDCHIRCCLTWLLSWWTAPLSPAAPAQGFYLQSVVERSPPSCRHSCHRFRFVCYLLVFRWWMSTSKWLYHKTMAERALILHMCGTGVEVVIRSLFRFRLQMVPSGNMVLNVEEEKQIQMN